MAADQSENSLSAGGSLMQLELEDGYSCVGSSFGAERCAAGEVVFQTGMVGYPESLTDPSYRGQILVCTFPLAGNYGVPSRKAIDELLGDLPAYFEASEIHVAGLVVASYSGENFSHFLADSSLGTWLKENNVPAIHAVDTRAITKKVREKGSMLARLRLEESHDSSLSNREHTFADVEWYNPNKINLVPQGELPPSDPCLSCRC